MAFTRRDMVASGVAIIAANALPSGAAPRQTGVIEVRAPAHATQGTLRLLGREYNCTLGRSGIVEAKHEGDGGTPAGIYPLREVRYRADRVARPKTGLPIVQTNPDDGWCDEPADPAYNRLVRLPYKSDAETMWREDHAYDLLAVIGYNDAPVVPGAGSAIFLHVARADSSLLPTSGCVALNEPDLRTVLAGCAAGTMIDIQTM